MDVAFFDTMFSGSARCTIDSQYILERGRYSSDHKRLEAHVQVVLAAQIMQSSGWLGNHINLQLPTIPLTEGLQLQYL